MALNTSRTAWSTSRQALRPFIPAAARPACRANHQIARHPTALGEKNDLLNEPISEADIGGTAKVVTTFYERFLGRNGSKLLPEEIKWLAVTHKSFDFGRRGFNTRLAYYGRQIIVLEAMNEIMTSPRVADEYLGDPWKRKHYESPALQNVDKLSMTRPQDMVSVSGLASVGLNNRLNEVMRWKPRNPDNLKGSGIETVLATSIFAIIGAVSLQHGAEAASKLAREKVIRRIKQ
ncbi:hypothetical protein INS49_015360 [Diaporthe citri]|uniref:uncharacterized protein n=1 Tax=Diaporthe citri TaxID=83186 RepID=UPI001C8033A4|nr:uncharacterized protein INS49_015360 [Diaporthe citri]KAG6355975.1 hypothetical protein INS49_015360 [Diaporthe citri]